LKSTEGTVEAWLSQIGTCIDNILRVSSSDLAEIGPMVLRQDREISSQLARIELLEAECEKDNDEVKETIRGLSSLMQLVGEHVEKSKYVRDRLQLLTFNSIVESSRLGKKADAILEISQSIKRISVDWSALTDRSAQAMDEILGLVDQAGEGMRAFSNEGNAGLRVAQEDTRVGLESLREVAAFTAEKVAEVGDVTERLKAKIAAVIASKNRLADKFAEIAALSEELESVRLLLRANDPGGQQVTDRAAVEAYYSESYTTEIEREVMRAALSGGPLPVVEQNVTANDVELF
jgi:methyl-accepting chemotaxis protein